MVAAASSILVRFNRRCGDLSFSCTQGFQQLQGLCVARSKPSCCICSVSYHKRRFAGNVWTGIVHGFLIGTYWLPRRLSALINRVFVKEKLPANLEEFP
jgi:hypothetical protein